MAKRVFATPAVRAEERRVRRSDHRARSRRRGSRRGQPARCAASARDQRRIHERGVTGGGVAVLPQRPLSEPGDVPVRHRGGDAARVRGGGPRGLRAADRLSGPRDGAPHPVRGARPRRVQEGRAPAHRGAQPRARQVPPDQARVHLCWATTRDRNHYEFPRASSTCLLARRPALSSKLPTHATRTSGACSSA